ncbi:MAG: DUF1330 domain-containing protein [Gemmobacter sp.]
MPKGYWVAHVDVRDAQAYEAYRRANAAVFARFGARFIVRGAPQKQMEGQCRARTVVIEFPTLEAAQACYASPEYQAAKVLRDPVSTGDLVILAGWEG